MQGKSLDFPTLTRLSFVILTPRCTTCGWPDDPFVHGLTGRTLLQNCIVLTNFSYYYAFSANAVNNFFDVELVSECLVAALNGSSHFSS